MRLAIITDIHGNIHALEAILEDIKTQGVDEIIIAGDTINIHPHSRQCFEIVMALGCPVLQGNHEEYVYSVGSNPTLQEQRFQSVRWTHQQFTDAQLETMRTLPKTLHRPNLLITHATPRNLSETIREDTSLEDSRAMFAGTTEQFIVRGHNHRWFTKNWDNRTLFSLESAGLPLGGRLEAQYAILTKRENWSLEQRFVNYNFEAALADFNDEYIQEIGALGHLLRLEFVHGKGFLVRFLQQYLVVIDAKEISLEDAVTKFSLECVNVFI
jgi:predicted phosphodiesterase